MDILIMIVSAMLILTGLVVLHEYGHYRAAKRNGIRVQQFSIGFGPRLIRWHRGETEFSFRPILFGGYVAFADDVDKDPEPGDFRTASLKARALTAAAGPAMNVAAAVVLAVIMLLVAPEFQAVRVATVEPGSPAAEAGIEPGDVLKKMNGVDMDFYATSVMEYQQTPRGESMQVRAARDGDAYETTVHFDPDDDQKLMGVTMETQPYNFFEAFTLSFKWLGQQIGAIYSALGNLFFRGQGMEDMAGIVGTTVVVGNVVQYGTIGLLLMLISVISINLAIINLLPIPALDGGKLVLFGVEALRKKAVPQRIEGIMNFAGMAVIMGLAVFLVFQDISRLVT